MWRYDPDVPACDSTVTPDAFKYLPDLRNTLTPPDKSRVRITPNILAEWDAHARELGQPDDWRIPDQQREDGRRVFLGQDAGSRDLWIYSYGSLMWDPGLFFAEVRLADLAGYQRRFTFRSRLGRGSPQRPALMLSLEQHAACHCRGLAFRIAAELVDAESTFLWRREMIRGNYCPMWLPIETPQGPVTALVFASNPSHRDYVGELPMQETAAIISSASGMIGSNRQYLEYLATQLRALSIEDPYIETLMCQVRDSSPS